MDNVKKDLEFWKNNAEENYLTTPISVLRYISELEKEQEKRYSEEDVENILIEYVQTIPKKVRNNVITWFINFNRKYRKIVNDAKIN